MAKSQLWRYRVKFQEVGFSHKKWQTEEVDAFSVGNLVAIFKKRDSTIRIMEAVLLGKVDR